MSLQQFNKRMFFIKNTTIQPLIKSIIVTLGVTIMLFSIALPTSCSGRKTDLAPEVTNRDSIPVLRTIGLESLVSDSGVIRYRVTAGEWLIYDKMDPQFWAFERGIHLERFDSLLRVDADIKADTAYFYNQERLWKLISNVEIVNLSGERFLTNLLYWNQETEKVYTDAYVTIHSGENVLHGYGMDADQRLENFVIRRPMGDGYINLNENKQNTDSIE